MSDSEISFNFDDDVIELDRFQQHKPNASFSKSDKKNNKEKLKLMQTSIQSQNNIKQQMTKDLLFLLKFEQHMLSSINSLHQRIMRSLESEIGGT
ncbi:unnamed protein product (macronuclear) [Paramecium tetraurelia]|uniref:Uncharacterized protein n=1 Tax=Paramecium tetraurelia TaxID=5888 RepID=A0BRQ3_PARTE|nr:uncharacterized protein GSPATT00031451001 [Paramecium tetraurelia]CAK61220.1 unnamed protein product [Paramecium tetraurelia]|eukprot:XP_001428618.1 hypothetical protein (macronuclear) [Paramecium tetraurelia strain d4-2]